MSCIAKRVKEGCFSLLFDQFMELKPSLTPAIGAMEFGIDLFSNYTFKNEARTFGIATFYSLGSTPNDEAILLFFGQIAKEGTKVGSFGNQANPGPPVTDGTTIKDVIVLEYPSPGSPELEAAWNNQISVLNHAFSSDRNTFPEDKFDNADSFSMLSRSQGSTDFDLIKFTSEAKFVVPKDEAAAPVLKRKNLLLHKPIPASSSMQEQGGKPNVNDVTVKAGALYDPALLKDYSPDYFQFKRAKLVQFPYEDANKKLIAPWDVHSKLRPGTLVTIEAKMICWLNTDRMKPHTLRKNYHLQIVKVRVFADSDLPMHPLDTPKVLSPPSPESSKTPAKRELASDKFTTFSATPVKKSKK